MISFVIPGKGPNNFNLQTGKEVIAMKILLVCAGGMSTSVLVDKMAAYTKGKGIEADIDARAFQRVEDRIHQTDILLIGPQVRFMAKKFQDQYGGEVPVIQIMDMSDYALQNVEKIFEQAYREYQEKTS